MNVGSLFSGIGGMDAGLARAGFQHSFLCEWDEWRRGVLRERFPGVPVYDDVRAVRLEPAAGGAADGGSAEPDGAGRLHASAVPVDLLCGGFPCQDLSVAGRRAGLEAGERSSLFFEFMRVADELVPPGGYVLIENVPGLLSSQGGRDFAIVLASLAELGFHDLAWRVLDSRYFGVPQRRRRVFVLARRCASGRRCCEVLLEPEGGGGDFAAGGEARPGLAGASEVSTLTSSKAGGWRVGSDEAAGGQLIATARTLTKGERYDGDTETFVVEDTLASGSHPGSNMPGRRREDDTNIVAAFYSTGGTHGLHDYRDGTTPPLKVGTSVGAPSGIAVSGGAAVRRLTPIECERLQGLPDDWTKVPDTAPDSRRYAGLGDAVTANVAEWIGRRLLHVEAAA